MVIQIRPPHYCSGASSYRMKCQLAQHSVLAAWLSLHIGFLGSVWLLYWTDLSVAMILFSSQLTPGDVRSHSVTVMTTFPFLCPLSTYL
jgi:hypothetical protein